MQPNIPRRKGGVDFFPFVVGVITLLKQFHSIHTQKFLALLGQYVRSYVNFASKYVGGLVLEASCTGVQPRSPRT